MLVTYIVSQVFPLDFVAGKLKWNKKLQNFGVEEKIMFLR